MRELIASGRCRPGDRLPAERELALVLGVSRPALREALRRLESGGVLDSRRGSGTYVAEVDLPGVLDVRLRLEPLAAEQAANRRTDLEAAHLRSSADRLGGLLDDPPEFAACDAKIHAMLADAAHSPVLRTTLERLNEMMWLSRAVTVTSAATRRAAVRDMQRIVTAVERGHPKRAANAMERHLLGLRAQIDGGR